jgi:hypothetical protein
MTYDDSGVLKPDTYHSPLAIDFITLCNYFPQLRVLVQQICDKGLHCIVLVLHSLVTSCLVYETTTVDTAVASLSAFVRDPMEPAVARASITRSELTQWFSAF